MSNSDITPKIYVINVLWKLNLIFSYNVNFVIGIVISLHVLPLPASVYNAMSQMRKTEWRCHRCKAKSLQTRIRMTYKSKAQANNLGVRRRRGILANGSKRQMLQQHCYVANLIEISQDWRQVC